MFLGLGVVDWIIVVLALAAAWTGWRHGLVVGLLSFIGFVGGAFLGLALVPWALSGLQHGVGVSVLAVGLVLVVAFVTQTALAAAGGWVRSKITVAPARFVDATLGAALAVIGLLVATWAVGLTAGSAAIPSLSAAVRDSKVLPVVDDVVPVSPSTVRSAFQDIVASGGFPEVVVPWAEEPVREVDPPGVGVGREQAVRDATASVVQVIGEAPTCGRVIEGSGFVVGPERVMTNAHVVAGVEDPVITFPDGEPLAAEVVFVDPEIDVAVLSVSALDLAPLPFAEAEASSGTEVAAIGYPGGGPRTTNLARVRDSAQLVGRDIYDDAEIEREVLALRGTIRPGNSGGPVVNAAGEVVGVVFASSLTDPDTGYALSPEAVAAAREVAAAETVEAVPAIPCT